MSILRNLAQTYGLANMTPLEQASRELEQARRDHLNACAARELASAHEAMLVKRIVRLAETVKTLATDEGTSS